MIVGRKVFDGCHDVLTLNPTNVGHGRARSQIRILAETLEVAATVRGAMYVDARCKQHVLAVCARLAAQRLSQPFDELGVKSGCQGNARGKPGGLELGGLVYAHPNGTVGHVQPRYSEPRHAHGIEPCACHE